MSDDAPFRNKPTDPGHLDLSAEALEGMSADEQKEAMREWFNANYEDPVVRTPYESAEGGYIYIWGGPYDTGDVLGGRFGGLVPDEVIEDLVSDLEVDAYEWTSAPQASDYEQDDDEDPLPPSTPPEVRDRFNELISRHDEWNRANPIPVGDEEAARAEVLRRLDAADEALQALARLRRPGSENLPGIGHNGAPPDIVPAGAEAPDPPLPPEEAKDATVAISAARAEIKMAEPSVPILELARAKLGGAVKATAIVDCEKPQLGD